MTVSLHSLEPFAKGGNRLCYVDPKDSNRCIKVRRPDFTLEDLRRSKGFPKRLRPLSSFDDNAEEYRVMRMIQKRYGSHAFNHISKCYDFVETDMGKGLASELIRDANGGISYSLKQYLNEEGNTDSFQNAAKDFCDFWSKYAIPSRDLLLHNIVAQRDQSGNVKRLVVIDGLGSSTLIPTHWQPKKHQKDRAQRKTKDFQRRIDKLLNEIQSGKKISSLGQLIHNGTQQ